MDWLRLYHGTATDPKFRTIAKRSGQSVASVLAVWLVMLESASSSDNRGELSGWDDEDVAISLDLETEQVISIRQAMQGKTLEGDHLTGWEKRQPNREREDSSAERVRKYRAKKAEENRDEGTEEEHVTPCNATVTPSNAIEEKREEEKIISPDSSSQDTHSSVNAQERSSVSISSVTPTQAGAMTKALRPHNIPVTPSHPELLAWIAEGASVDLVLEAVELARMQKPAPQKIAPAYLTAIVRSLLAGPKSNGARAGPRNPNKHEARMEFWKQMNGGGENGRDSKPERVIEGEAERVG